MGIMKQETIQRGDSNLGKTGGSAVISLKHKLYKPKVGLAFLDIIPFMCTTDLNKAARKGDYSYVTEYSQHAIGSSYATVKCACLKGIGQQCPVCEEVSRLYDLRDGGSGKELASKMRAKVRNLFHVIDRNNLSAGIQVLDISYKLFTETLLKAKNKYGDHRFAGFMELEDGLTLEVNWEEKSIGQGKCIEAQSITFVKRDYTYPMEILKDTEDLDLAIQYQTAVQIKELMFGDTPHEDDDTPYVETTTVANTTPTPVTTIPVQSIPKPAPVQQAPAAPQTRVEPVGFATPPVTTCDDKSCPAGRAFGTFNKRDASCQACVNYRPCREEALSNM